MELFHSFMDFLCIYWYDYFIYLILHTLGLHMSRGGDVLTWFPYLSQKGALSIVKQKDWHKVILFVFPCRGFISDKYSRGQKAPCPRFMTLLQCSFLKLQWSFYWIKSFVPLLDSLASVTSKARNCSCTCHMLIFLTNSSTLLSYVNKKELYQLFCST